VDSRTSRNSFVSYKSDTANQFPSSDTADAIKFVRNCRELTASQRLACKLTRRSKSTSFSQPCSSSKTRQIATPRSFRQTTSRPFRLTLTRDVPLPPPK
jgi:hypothetical protein